MKLIKVTGNNGTYKINPDNIVTIDNLGAGKTELTTVCGNNYLCSETPDEIESLIQKADNL